jgi:hypothetical protein
VTTDRAQCTWGALTFGLRAREVESELVGALRCDLQRNPRHLQRLDSVSGASAAGLRISQSKGILTFRNSLLSCNSLLTLPNASRARHKITNSGMMEATRTHAVYRRLTESIASRFGCIAELCEVLKREGLPGNEVSCSRVGRIALSSTPGNHFCSRVYQIGSSRSSMGACSCGGH